MKFYVIEDDKCSSTPIDCFTSLVAARKAVKQLGNGYSIKMIECPVNSDTIARLLGNMGGYAIAIERDLK